MAIGDRMAGQGPARQYSNQRANPRAFGAGIETAIKGLAGATEDSFNTTLALRERLNTRANKTEGFDTERRYIEYIGEQNRRQAERIRGAAESANGITNQTEAELQAAREEFIQTVPERLQPEYRAKLESYEQNTITSAFNFEYTAGNQKFVKDVNDTLNAEASSVLLGEKSADEARENIFGLIESSDLDEPAKRDLRDQSESFLLKAEYQKEVEYAVDFRGTVEPKTEGDVVAAGLLPHERGILNAIASPESSDRYDVIYSGKKITDFSDHPREYIEITSGPNKGKKSSAAGKYQFLASTWDATVRAYNAAHPDKPVTDFRPESQDRIALFYARRIYNRQLGAGEMTFDEVLTSGNRDLIVSMKNQLTDDKGGWEGFRHMSDDAFANIIMGTKGIRGGGTGSPGAPDVWENPKYAALSFEDKNQLAGYAAKSVAERDLAAAKAAKIQQDAVTEQAMFDAMAGKYTLADMDQLVKGGILPDSAAASKWKNLVEEANKGRTELERVTSAINSGGTLYASDDKGLNLFLGKSGIERMQDFDTDYAEQTLMPVAARAGFFPSDYAEQLNSMVLSSNTQAREYATAILGGAAATDPRILDRSPGLSEQAKKQVLFADQLRGIYTPEEVAERLKAANDPQQAKSLEAARSEAAKVFDKNYTTENILGVFDSWMPFDASAAPITRGQNAMLRQDYQTAFVEGYVITGTEDGAKNYADKMIVRNWFPSNVGGTTRLSKHPPETYYETIAGSHDWIDAQARNELGFSGSTQFQLIPDAQTEHEGRAFAQAKDKSGMNNASYQVAFLNDEGLPEIMLNEDGEPIRWAAEITDDMKRKMELASQYESLKVRRDAIAMTGSMGGAMPEGTAKEFQDIQLQMEELEQEAGGDPIAAATGKVTGNKVDLTEQLRVAKEGLDKAFAANMPASVTRNLTNQIKRLEAELENVQ